MTREETKQILLILKINYPQSFKDWNKAQITMFIDLWTEAFQHDNVAVVTNAVKSIIYSTTREFAPNIGQVKDMMQRITTQNGIDADEAWGMVYKALGNSIYNAKEEFEKLPDEVKAGIGSYSQLREWAQMDARTLETVIASNFKKGYRTRVEEKREFEKLPVEAKQMINQLTNGMKMIE